MALMWKRILCGVTFLSLHSCGKSNGGTLVTEGNGPPKLIPAQTPDKVLLTSNSDKQEVKLEHKGVRTSDEKLGTSATFPIPAGIIYDAPLTSGAYAGFGPQPAAFVAPQYQHGGLVGSEHLHGHGQILNQGGYGHRHGGGHGIVSGYGHHGGQVGGYALGGQIGGYGLEGHGGGYHGHHGGQIGGYGLGEHGGGYQGVIYGGHGNPHIAPYHQEQIKINKQSEVAVGPYGEVHRGQAIQKTISNVGPHHGGGGHLGPVPYSPYGHGGVVYMGNGLIPEHVAGVKLVGPVLPPPGYQQHENVVIKQGTGVGPYGNVHSGVTLKSTVNSVGLDGIHGGFGNGYGNVPYHQGNFHQPGYPHGRIYPQHQQVSIDKVSGVDPYGNVMKDVSIRKQIQSGPGLGYNGIENVVIAQTDQAILGPHHHQYRPHHHDGGRGFGNPDPYFNNLVDPVYRTGGIGHSASLLTTGPNRYYQGKNPIGVYERYHRLG